MWSPSPRSLVLLIALAAAVYLVGNARVSLWDRDEPRYAQTSRQMLDSGDWVVPRYLDKVRTAKPVFIYWCQAASMSLLGREGDAGVFAARLPSAVAMAGVLVLVAAALWRSVGPAHAFWATLVLATSALVVWSAKACTTDAVLLVGITAAQLCLYRLWRGRGTWPVVIALAAAVGVAGLTKGPVVLGVMGMTLLALGAFRSIERLAPVVDAWVARRRARSADFEPATTGSAPSAPPLSPGEGRGEGSGRDELRNSASHDSHPQLLEESRAKPGREPRTASPVGPSPRPSPGGRGSGWSALAKALVAFTLIAAIVAPWLYLVAKREAGFLGTSVSHDVFTRVVKPLEGHRGPPGYHLALIFATFLPWSALLPMAVVSAWQTRRADPRVRFALAAVLGPWVLFELVQTKLPHYMLPVFPPLAFLAADAIVRCLRGEKDDLRRPSFVVAAGVVGLAIVGLGIGTFVLASRFRDARWPAVALVVTTLLFALVVAVAFAKRKVREGLLATGLGMVAVYAVLFAVCLPRAGALRLSARVASVLAGERASEPGGAIMLDYKEPSLAFYEGGTIREESAMALSHALLDGAPRGLVITREVWEKTPADVRTRLEIVDSVKGFAYADGGRTVEVMVVRNAADERRSDAPCKRGR